MDLPRVNPIGLVEHPEAYRQRPRRYTTALRLAASVVLVAFVLVGVTATIYTLGSYCLTSHAGAPVPTIPR